MVIADTDYLLLVYHLTIILCIPSTSETLSSNHFNTSSTVLYQKCSLEKQASLANHFKYHSKL